MRALVTGGAGLIGSHLVDMLVRAGHTVRSFDALEPLVHRDGAPSWLSPHAEFVHGDVRDADAVARALDGIDVVFHLAAYGGFFPDLSKLCDVNVTGTAVLLETIRDRAQGVRKVVVASSQVVYREGAVRCPVHGVQNPPSREVERLRAARWSVPCPVCSLDTVSVPTPIDAPASGQTPYAVSKYAQERLALVWGEQTGTPVVALRFPCTYGPRQSIFNPYTGIIAIFCTRLLNGLAPVLYEDGEQTRDLCYVEDVARATMLAADGRALDGRAVNVGSGRPVSVRRVAEIVAGVLDSPMHPEMHGDFRPGDLRALFTESDVRAPAGFMPRVELRAGVARYVEWIRSRSDVREYFAEAQERLRSSGLVHRSVENVARA